LTFGQVHRQQRGVGALTLTSALEKDPDRRRNAEQRVLEA
jgi:hypothetical protein